MPSLSSLALSRPLGETKDELEVNVLHYQLYLENVGDVGWQPTIHELCICCIITFTWGVLGV